MAHAFLRSGFLLACVGVFLTAANCQGGPWCARKKHRTKPTRRGALTRELMRWEKHVLSARGFKRVRYINGMEVCKKRPRGFKKRSRGFKRTP